MKTRRKFLTDSWKWGGLIFVPRLLRAQPVFPPAFWGPAATSGGGGGGGSTIFISSFTGSPSETDFAGKIGMEIVVGGASITVTDLGVAAWASAADISKTVQVWDSSCVSLVSCPVDVSSHDGAVHFASCSPTVLSSGGTYYIGFINPSGAGQEPYSFNFTAVHGAAATIPQDMGAGSCTDTILGSANKVNGVVNFKYT